MFYHQLIILIFLWVLPGGWELNVLTLGGWVVTFFNWLSWVNEDKYWDCSGVNFVLVTDASLSEAAF